MTGTGALPGLSAAVAARLVSSTDRIVVTGAGGWLGMASLELLANALGAAANKRIRCFGASRRLLQLRDGTMWQQQPLAEIATLSPMPTLVLHLAFLTKDRAETMDDDSYVAANRALSRQVLDALAGIGAHAVFVASSGAAYQAENMTANRAMRLYGTLKQQDEEAFADWASDAGRRCVIARIFNVTGPYISMDKPYAIASFLRAALSGQPIEVRAPHPVIRGNVAIRELMSLVFALLLDGKSGVTRFDSGGEALELADVARTVARHVADVPVVRAAITNTAADHYAGDADQYRRLLDSHGIAPVSLGHQLIETAAYLRGL